MRSTGVGVVTGAMLLFCGAAAGRAEFIIGTSSSGEKFYNGDAIKDVNVFTGTVGGQNTGDSVTVQTNVNVDTGAGFSAIKPADINSDLTTIIFTPSDPNLFDSFSFGGLLNESANGTVYLTVQDNQGDAPQTFTYTGLGNGNIGSLGIVAVSGSGETIQSITLTSSWKQEQQNLFSYAAASPHPVPEPGTMTLLGFGAVAAGVFLRRRKKPAA